jgi:hypothetical protein
MRALLGTALGAAVGLLTVAQSLATEEITERARKQAMAKAPALIKALKVSCDVVDARKIQQPVRAGSLSSGLAGAFTSGSGGGGSGGSGGGGSGGADSGGGASGGGTGASAGASGTPLGGPSQPDQYEVACQQGLGYLITEGQRGQPPIAYLCIEATPGAGAGPGPGAMQCALTGNLAEAQRAAVAGYVAKAAPGCELDRWRGVGRTSSNTLIEVSCRQGAGQMLLASNPLAPDKEVEAVSCLGMDSGGAVKCTLSDPAAQLARADKLFGDESARDCKVRQRRYMLTATTGDVFYEFLCEDGKGYVMQQKSKGEFGGTAECSSKVASDLGGCTLKP